MSFTEQLVLLSLATMILGWVFLAASLGQFAVPLFFASIVASLVVIFPASYHWMKQ